MHVSFCFEAALPVCLHMLSSGQIHVLRTHFFSLLYTWQRGGIEGLGSYLCFRICWRRHFTEAVDAVERKQTEMSDGAGALLPFSSSVTLGPSLHSPKPCSTATNMVFNLLQLDISLWGCIWLMANIWWRQSFRQGLDVLSTSNIQTLGNSEMIKVFIQMLIWLSGNNPDVWVIYKSLWGLFKESFCESLQRVYLECLTWKFKFWFLKTYDLGFFKTTHCSPAWYIVAVFLLFPVHCLHWLCVHVHLCASFS